MSVSICSFYQGIVQGKTFGDPTTILIKVDNMGPT